MNNTSEQIFQAVEYVTNAINSNLKYDKTVKATIYSIKDINDGIYKVRYQDNIFDAYANDTQKKYKKDEQVYVKVPEGDFSNKKIITGLVTARSLSDIEKNQLTHFTIETSPDFEQIYSYNNEGPWEVVAGQSQDQQSQGIDYIYGDESDTYSDNQDHKLFQQYANQCEYIRIKGNFKTQFYSKHSVGNYGIEIAFYAKGKDYAKDKDNIIIVAYRLSLDSFNGDPYNFSVYSPQQIIFKVQKNYLLGLKYVKFFQDGFNYDEKIINYNPEKIKQITDDPNIFVQNVEIGYVDVKDLTQEGFYCYIVAKRGTIFPETPSLPIELEVKLLSYGDPINADSCTFKWFERDLSVVVGDERYDKDAGYGWVSIDQTGNIIKLNKEDVLYKKNYKCIVKYYGSKIDTSSEEETLNSENNNSFRISPKVTMSVEKEVFNSGANYSFHIEQKTNGDSINLQLINEKTENVLMGNWYLSQPDGSYVEFPDGKNKNSILIQDYLIYTFLTFYCEVYDYEGQNIVGITEHTVYNSNSKEDVFISYKGEDTFRYNSNGDIPIEDAEKGRTLQIQLEWKEGYGTSYRVEWLGPDGEKIPTDESKKYSPKSSMMENIWIDTNNILRYNIKQKYRENYYNDNTFTINIITIDEKIYTFKKEIIFVKDGDQGTNGTTYICAIRPCESDGSKISGIEALQYNADWNNTIQLKCYVYKDGEPLNFGSNPDPNYNLSFSWEAVNVRLSAGISEDIVQDQISVDQVTVHGEGIISQNSTAKDLERYVKVSVRINDQMNGNVEIHTSYPIDVIVGNLDQDLIDINNIPSYVKYTSSGINPSFYNDTLKFLYEGESYSDSIKPLNKNVLDIKDGHLKPASSFMFESQLIKVSPDFNQLYLYDSEKAWGIVAGQKQNEQDRGITYIYGNDSNSYSDNQYHRLFQEYANQYEDIRIKGNFKTQFYSEHSIGSYGIEVAFYTKENNVITYRLDSNSFNQNPYDLSAYSIQQIIFKVQKNFLLGLKYIKFFQDGFNYDEKVINNETNEIEQIINAPNIFVENVEIGYVEENSSIGVLKCEKDDNNYIIHPVIMYLDTYGNEAINSWDGTQLVVDKDKGQYIFAPQIGAGEKNDSNQFTGVVMGKDSGIGKIGLYGYQEGINTFGLQDDGTAFFGVQGTSGRIEINSKSGIITSGAYFNSGGTEGMKINLNDGHIDAYNFLLTSGNMTLNSSNQSFEFKLGDNSNSKFCIYFPEGMDVNNQKLTQTKKVFNIDKDDYYLQTLDFVQEKSGTPGAGTQIDLKNGKIISYNFQIKTPTMNIDSGTDNISKFSFNINEAGEFIVSNGKTFNDRLIYLKGTKNENLTASGGERDSGSFYIQSNNYKVGTADTAGDGMKIDLVDGSIYSYNFKLKSSSLKFDSSEGQFVFYLKDNKENNGNNSYFKIYALVTEKDSNGQDVANNKLVFDISGTNSFKLQSQNFNTDTNSEAGTRIDLYTGRITSYNFQIDTPRLKISSNNGTDPIYKNAGKFEFDTSGGGKFKICCTDPHSSKGEKKTLMCVIGGYKSGNATDSNTSDDFGDKVGTKDTGSFYLQSYDYSTTATTTNAGTGTRIDLTNGRITSYNFTLKTKYITMSSDETGIFAINVYNGGKFQIKDQVWNTETQKYDDKILFSILGNDTSKNYYLQSKNYSTTDETGTQIDITNGTITSWNFSLNTPYVTIKSGKDKDKFQFIIYADKWNSLTQEYEKTDIFYIDKSNYLLKSKNYSRKDYDSNNNKLPYPDITGIKIDLKSGSMEVGGSSSIFDGKIVAKSGQIGGWTINSSQITTKTTTSTSWTTLNSGGYIETSKILFKNKEYSNGSDITYGEITLGENEVGDPDYLRIWGQKNISIACKDTGTVGIIELGDAHDFNNTGATFGQLNDFILTDFYADVTFHGDVYFKGNVHGI